MVCQGHLMPLFQSMAFHLLGIVKLTRRLQSNANLLLKFPVSFLWFRLLLGQGLLVGCTWCCKIGTGFFIIDGHLVCSQETPPFLNL